MGRETLFWAICTSLFLHVVSFESFNDNIQFDVSWSGPVSLREGQVTKDGKDFLSNMESVFITTKNNEKYQCILPSERITNQPGGEYGPGPDPADLLAALADDGKCSYRLEAYWTYEICHGKHVRQFHDERAQKGAKVQEFFLGKVIPKEKSEESSGPAPIPPPPAAKTEQTKPKSIPTRRVEGRDLPYYEVVMGNGTPCDLLGHRPREVHLLYLCHPQSHNEIMSIKEVSTCTYEVEILTPLLCSNDEYKFHDDPIHRINCHSFPGSPDEPLSYAEMIEDQRIESSGQKETMLFSDVNAPEDPPIPQQQEPKAAGESWPPADYRTKILTPKPDEQLTKDFLRGEHCLQGGTGWWKYELCYGKQVIQYHVDEDHGGRTDILLGVWHKEKHIQWTSKKSKKPVGYAVHLYTGGDMCDLTGQPRQVQVRLKCKESSHLQEVSLYLMEPNVCEYILGVESPIICSLLDKVDEYGLFPIE